MFNFFQSNPTKKLRKQLAKLQADAMLHHVTAIFAKAQRISAEADKIWQEIQELKVKRKAKPLAK